jgi:uncharacterized phage-associated protein
MAKCTAQDVANYFLLKAQEEDQELLSNIKLQKLIYYAQGIHLAEKGIPLFDDKIMAWLYGPVIPELYRKYKHCGAGGIPADEKFDPSCIDNDTKTFLDGIYDFFGQYAAVKLMQLAHNDQCYIDAGINNEITCEAMQDDLKAWLNG